MKGIVFTEFLEMVEQKHGFALADALISENKLESNGIYTEVGDYSHGELIKMVVKLHEKTGVALDELLELFAFHLYKRFKSSYPDFFKDVHDAIEFLDRVEDHIHTEVRKIYPNSNPPEIKVKKNGVDYYVVSYRSSRGLGGFALGMIKACVADFGHQYKIETSFQDDQMKYVEFILQKA